MIPYAHLFKLRDHFYTLRQRAMGYPKLHRAFLRNQGYPLNLDFPVTHNQRLVHKMICDRSSLIPITSDKWRVRTYVKEILGAELAEKILIPVYHVSKTGRDIPHTEWNHEFFLKANHGSRLNKLVQPGDSPQSVSELAVSWLGKSYGQGLHEWAYRDIPRRIICEKVLRDRDGKIPMDVKFYCYHGKCKMVYYVSDRYEGLSELITDEKQVVLPFILRHGVKLMSSVPVVANFDQMLGIAEALSQRFIFSRVDLYSVEGKVYFGELTHYDGAGMERLQSYEADLAEGRLWLTQNYHKSLAEVYSEVLEENKEGINKIVHRLSASDA